MAISDPALDPQYTDAIKGFEGYSPGANWDYKQSSSGYGTKVQPGDENIPPDQLQGVHEQRFHAEIGKAAQSVDAFAPDLPPGVRAALASLTYNAGPGWQQSGLGAAIKAGDIDKAREIFLQYNKAGGEVNPGLVARRQKEAEWFSGSPQPAPASPQPPPAGLLQQSVGGLLNNAAQSPPLQIPPQAAPQFAGGGQAQQAAPFQVQAPQIQFAPRRQIDLSRLRAQLSAPQFTG